MATKDQFSAGQLKSFVERIERLEEEKKALTTDIAEVYEEVKAFGYDAKILRKVIKLRAMDEAERAEEATLIDVYMRALGMTPLEEAIEREKVRDAVKKSGMTPTELTDKEKAEGADAAFVHKDGTRSTVTLGGKRSRAQAPAQAAE